MWERFRRFSAKEHPAQSLFLRAMVLLPVVAVSLRWRGFRATQAALQRFVSNSDTRNKSSNAFERARLTAHMVYAAERHGLFRPTCLALSLTLWWLLERQGIESHLRVGIRKEDGKFEAHAWVERDGAALNEPEKQHHHYAAFDGALS
jgi:Transglutaminase-like superfamily